MSQNRFSPKLIVSIILILFVGVSLYLRIVPPYDQVFSGDWIKLASRDAYHYMHQVDNLVRNFPHLISLDPYMRYPHGWQLGSLNLFVYFLGGIAWLVGLGSPTQHTIDVVGAYFPAIVGALTVIPVYFTGKALFNRWAGVLAAGLIVIYPGEFLARSSLGFTDRDSVEVLFTALTMLFLILAIKSARQKQLTFSHLKRRDWAGVTKPLIYSLLAGIFLGIYLLTWKGAFIFVFIIFVYFIIQFIIDHLRHQSTDYLCFVGTITFLIALIIFWPAFPSKPYLVSLVIALFTPAVLAGVSWLTAKMKIRRAYYPLVLIVLGLVGLTVSHVINPRLLSEILGGFGPIFAQPATGLIVMEQQPILFPGGNFSLSVVWGNFTTSFFLSFITLGILIFFIIKRGEADKTLLTVWSLVMLVLTLAMRRFAPLFAVNVALLTGYFSWLILEFVGLKQVETEPVERLKKAKRKAKKKARWEGGFRLTSSRANMALVLIVVFFLVFFPNISPAINQGSQVPFAPSDAWQESLSWLKDNTPDPFGDPDFYYDLYETPFNYPDTAYGVAASWSYGYWIIRIGHRLPNCDPGGGARASVGLFFTAQDEASANERINKLGSKYVIIDYDTTTDKFYAVATEAGSSAEKFRDLYYWEQKGQTMVPVFLMYPEYYRSLAVRLYNFDGGEVTPQKSDVISYEEKVRRDGTRIKQITSLQSFPSYEEAEAYVLSQESENYRIVSGNPFISPVPLKALEHYQLVYSSDNPIIRHHVGRISEVKIFEYIGD